MSATFDFRFNSSPVTFTAPGNVDSLITGSRFADNLSGAGGDDHISGLVGDDVITGGIGADMMAGGAGNDRFTFNAGDLVAGLGQGNGHGGLVDQITDFHNTADSAGREHDVLQFTGYSNQASITFDHYAATRVPGPGGGYVLTPNLAAQYYHIVDPADHTRDGYVLVNMANGTDKLTTADYVFGHAYTFTVGFEDLAPSFNNSPVVDGYQGFNWHTLVTSAPFYPGSGYSLDPTQLAYNPYGAFPIDVSRSDGAAFQFNGGDFNAAWDSSEILTVSGLQAGSVVHSMTVSLSNTAITHLDTSGWGPIDDLRVDFVSGVDDPSDSSTGHHIVMDNLSFTTFI